MCDTAHTLFITHKGQFVIGCFSAVFCIPADVILEFHKARKDTCDEALKESIAMKTWTYIMAKTSYRHPSCNFPSQG
ncbi:unnamed protein product [Aphanomyces euteiches]